MKKREDGKAEFDPGDPVEFLIDGLLGKGVIERRHDSRRWAIKDVTGIAVERIVVPEHSVYPRKEVQA